MRTSIFSWEMEAMSIQNRKLVLDTLKICGANALYQEFSADQKEEDRTEFLQDMQKEDILVYYLTGKKEWGLPGYDGEIIKEIDRACEIKKQAGEGSLTGIVLDVEPYLTDEWDENQAAVMESYVDHMTEAYAYSRQKGLEVIICIPYYFDEYGYEEQLTQLISRGCDGVAVMNYYKEDEYRHIFTEAMIARAYDKEIIHIAELQKPGKHALEEINTYHNDGLDALWASWKDLDERFDYDKMGFSYHYLKPAMELYLDGEMK